MKKTKLDTKSIVVIFIFLAIICGGLFSYFYSSYSYNQAVKYNEKYKDKSFSEIIDSDLDDHNTVKNINDVYIGVLDVAENEKYEIIYADETVWKYSSFDEMGSSVSLKMNKGDIEYGVYIGCANGTLHTISLDIYIRRDDLNKIFITQGEIEPLLNVLKFDNGYTLLKDAYKNTELNPLEGSTKVYDGEYKIFIYEDIDNDIINIILIVHLW